MLKKFMNLFGGDKTEEKKTAASQPTQNSNSRDDEDDDDEEDDNEDDDEDDDDFDNEDDNEDDDDDDDDDDEEEDDDCDCDDEERIVTVSVTQKVEFDPVTLHGTNYSIEDFNAEVERRVAAWVKDEEDDDEVVEQIDIDNTRFNFRRDVYMEWTGAGMNQMLNWERANSMEFTGIASYGHTKQDDSNPLLKDIHGVSLYDYAAATYKIATGSKIEDILPILGIENPVWEEANVLWGKRMQEDTTFTVTTLFGQYYNTADQHPKLSGLVIELSEKGKETLAKMEVDERYYIELASATSTAYDFGIDGAKWLSDNYGITNGELQKVASKYADIMSRNMNVDKMNADGEFQEAMREKYAEIFAKEQGGNVSDDIEF